jgi:hypothetical protein
LLPLPKAKKDSASTEEQAEVPVPDPKEIAKDMANLELELADLVSKF